jgi:DNA-binding CsgD family transcriptional regulator
VQTLRLGEQHELALRLLDLALEGARREGHTARQGLIHGQRATIALAQGSLQAAQIEAETGLRLVQAPHFVVPQLVAVAIIVQIERGALTAAAELAPIVEALGVSEDRTFTWQFLVARGRLRIAQGHVREGVDDLLWCGERLEALSLHWPGDWRAYAAPALAALGERQKAAGLASQQLEIARRVGVAGPLGLSLRAAALAISGEERLGLLQEAVSVLESSTARLELAHAVADLGTELSRAGRRKEGRDAQRTALELARQCGAIALADRALAELQAGPGRRARAELTGPSALTAAEWQVCRQAADGRTNREIAQALFVTEKTVERHLSNAYHKLGVRSRFQLPAAIAE